MCSFSHHSTALALVKSNKYSPHGDLPQLQLGPLHTNPFGEWTGKGQQRAKTQLKQHHRNSVLHVLYLNGIAVSIATIGIEPQVRTHLVDILCVV
jgi:hypothetical protein